MMARSHIMLKLAVRPTHVRQQTVAYHTGSLRTRPMKVLGIETSADDTCVSLMRLRIEPKYGDNAQILACDKRTLANKKHRGIHPVEAVISHTQHLASMLSFHGTTYGLSAKVKPDLICVTRGPGMGGCLSVGVSTAKALLVSNPRAPQ